MFLFSQKNNNLQTFMNEVHSLIYRETFSVSNTLALFSDMTFLRYFSLSCWKDSFVNLDQIRVVPDIELARYPAKKFVVYRISVLAKIILTLIPKNYFFKVFICLFSNFLNFLEEKKIVVIAWS